MDKSNTAISTNSFPRFIENSPCGQDLFDGKSQDNIANNIANLLSNDKTCKIIGIDGGWGAGKSNLVYQVKNKLDKNFHFFIYDAWGHQEDLQRRAILEELTDELIEHELLPDKWKDKLKKLLAKSREIETKSIPKLSFGIIISGLAILLAPICKIIADTLDKKFLLYKLLIVTFPICLLLLTIIFYWLKEKNLKSALSNMYLLYQNKQSEDITFETISEAEPSVKKFKNWISEVSRDLKKKGVVLVFDNMDRLPKQKVQQLWSAIHIFFSEEAYENIRVIIPFDREHIKSAFKNEDIKGNNGDKYFGNDFIDKTFKVVYRVSPPIMSDWKKYFHEQWENAFGTHSFSVDYNKVVQIFDLISDDITPRKIIAYINEFVSIKLVFHEAIPDRYIALFIFGKQKIGESNPSSEIISPTYLKSINFLYSKDEEMPKYIASLYYQVAPENAIQIVFTDKLKKALNENNKEDILTISKIPGFYNLLENVIADVTNFENASLALANISNEEIGDTAQSQHIWDCIYKKVQYGKYPKVEDWQIALLDKVLVKDEFSLKILEGIVSFEKFTSTNYCESIDKIRQINDNIFNLLKEVVIPVEEWIKCVKLKNELWKNYKLYCKQEELDNYFSKLNYNNELSDDTFIKFIKSDYKLDVYIENLENLISGINTGITLENAEILYTKYKLANEKPLRLILEDERIYSYFKKLNRDSRFFYDILAMRIAKLTSFTSSYNPPFEPILNTENNDNLVKEVAIVIEYYINLDKLLLGLETFNKYPLYKNIVKYLINESVGESRLNIENILPKFDTICNQGEIEEQVLIKRLNNWSDDAKNVFKPDNIKSSVSVRFATNALLIKNDLSQYILTQLEDFLNSINFENWLQIFEDSDSYEFSVILLLSNFKIPQIAVDAIKDTLIKVAKREFDVPDKLKWNLLIERLESQNRGLVTIFNNIRDTFCREGNISNELFDFFGGWLFKYSKLEEKKEALRTIFKSEIIRNAENLKIILDNKEKMIDIVKIADEEAIDFKDIILDLLKTNTTVEFVEFASQIGVKIEIEESVVESKLDSNSEN